MRIVNMHEAKTQLSKLVSEAVDGDPFVIARRGTPLVRVTALESPGAGERKRLGFLPGISVPEDFDGMADDDISDLFAGS